MIALEASREQMLAEIGASAALSTGSATADLDRPDLAASEELRLLVRRITPEELLPALNSFLERRYADLPPKRVFRDLVWPLKKAVGNAHKRGNQRDPAKWITVEVIATPAGLFLEVSDEGAGFDVSAIVERYNEGREYWEHGGSGFRRFTRARSLVSFARGGATFRLRFLRAQATSGKRA